MQNNRIAYAAFLLACLLLCVLMPGAGAEESDALRTEAWKWDPGYVNSFSGELDLSGFAGNEVTLRVTADAEPAPEDGEALQPVFVIVDGKRIVMLSQKDTAQATAGESPLAFECSLRMPEEKRLRSLNLQVQAVDGEGKELARTGKTIYASLLGGRSNGNAFRIPFEIRTVAIWTGAAAAVLWLIALFRGLRKHKSH